MSVWKTPPMRLDRYCSMIGIGSRSDVATWCKTGSITVDNQIIKYPDMKTPRWSVISITTPYWWIIAFECKQAVTVLLHKPTWYVCSNLDEGGHMSYSNLLKNCPYRKSLQVAGRLDQDTTWLVICTNDGDLNHRIISPKHKLPKTYIVTCLHPLTDDMKDKLIWWVELDDGYQTLPAKIDTIPDEWLVSTPWSEEELSRMFALTIIEGKYHQVKRMLQAVGNQVIALHRWSVWPWSVSWLGLGEWRYIDEADSLF